MQVTPEELPAVASMVHGLCGVVLDSSKGYLIDARLASVAEEAGCSDFLEFCTKTGSNLALQQKVIDAITTQETLFFRDSSPFEALKHKAIPETIDAKADSIFPKRIRVWSAACSTGQEPYSIAMTFRDVIPDIASWDINILATDISDTAIAHASMGRYDELEVQRGMAPAALSKHFDGEEKTWKVKDDIRSMVRFQRLNLLDSFANLGPFDIIFCRNVAIYFETDERRDVFNRLADRLNPGGYLFVGSLESLNQLDPRFVAQHHCHSVYYQPQARSATV